MPLTPELEQVRDEIERLAAANGLDFFPVIFEMVDAGQMNELAAFDGFQVRFPHWSFAMKYDHLRQSYRSGFHKIYEMVLNANPAIAFLLEGNSLTEQKLVLAHVLAHADFFKNNVYFKQTNRDMLNRFTNHAHHIRRLQAQFGIEKIEKFLDSCLSLQNLIDPLHPFRVPVKQPTGSNPVPNLTPALHSAESRTDKPEADILLFLLEHAPLTHWQEIILNIIRDEAYYFAPQAQTKIINEGWATYWHSRLMAEALLTDATLIEYADLQSSALASGPETLNPYKLGVELFREIAALDDGNGIASENDCFGRATDPDAKNNGGLKKIFEVRQLHNDLSFIDNFLTEDFFQRHQFFCSEYNSVDDRFEVNSRSFSVVKNKLLQSLTNLGSPKIRVESANYQHQRGLLLSHAHDGIDLKINEARETLANLFHIWQAKVCLETVVDESRILLEFDGSEHHEQALE
jgi:stage V sporulation protein R